eukprot:TRINITY_DN15141_c0_g1_i1.p1 TRINITY_DN15141_c0_g1~~TRINITY_DN15141_c0_g1_i1.p1  ORF type:complete len:367 (-),score=36.48 TRINITY_DN15141_c0_g1_i1:108-1208(-)
MGCGASRFSRHGNAVSPASITVVPAACSEKPQPPADPPDHGYFIRSGNRQRMTRQWGQVQHPSDSMTPSMSSGSGTSWSARLSTGVIRSRWAYGRQTTNGAGHDKPYLHRPRRLILVRHGESEANVNRVITQTVPDHALHLTAKGRQQAHDAGKRLRDLIKDDSVFFLVSPYVRTRETFNGILKAGWPDHHTENVAHREDVQLREQDFGNYDSPQMKHFQKEKNTFGQFWFRFPEGESPADVYDRASSVLEGLYRRWEFSQEGNLVLVTHGLFILVFLMRLFRYTTEEFYELDAIGNCELVVLERCAEGAFYDVAFTWPVDNQRDHRGLRKNPAAVKQKNGLRTDLWDGDLKAPLIESDAYREVPS